MTKTLAEGTKSCGLFKPKSLLTRLILGVIAAAAMPCEVSETKRARGIPLGLVEATHSARHDRRHGKYVGLVTRTINQGRSRLCPCGSGKKYKRCHLTIDTAARIQMSGKSRATGVRLRAG